MYFSLQCGLLIKSHRKLLSGISHEENGGKVEYYIDSDKINVTTVIPSIELAHLCVNDSYRSKKHPWSIKHGLSEYRVGTYVFYKYIAPKILEIAAIAGIQYVYLFCADDGSENLIKYYKDVLHFDIMDDMACIRPDYDGSLECMTLKISDLEQDFHLFLDEPKFPSVLEFLNSNKTVSIQQAKKHLNILEPQLLFQKLIQNKLVEQDGNSDTGIVYRIKRTNSNSTIISPTKF